MRSWLDASPSRQPCLHVYGLCACRNPLGNFLLLAAPAPLPRQNQCRGQGHGHQQTQHHVRDAVGAICHCHRHALLPVNHHRDQRISSNPRPPGIALVFSLESLWSKWEELHSADAPTASRKPERGKRSFIDPYFRVPICTPCAEPAQNDKVDLTHSIAIT